MMEMSGFVTTPNDANANPGGLYGAGGSG